MSLAVPAAPISSYFAPAQQPPAGAASDNAARFPHIFKPISIRGLTFHNRIFLSPLAQYSANPDGTVTPWQIAHLGGIITRGPGLSIAEAAAVTPEGRTTPYDVGLWDDKHIEGWRQIVEFTHAQNQLIGIQIAHAGRKASGTALWIDGDSSLPEEDGGWPDELWGPSPISHSPKHSQPRELTVEGISHIVRAFASAATRAVTAGFDIIEIHAAHGYLIHEFLSPVSNKRTDQYGGNFENRIRFVLEIIDAVRAVIPAEMPLFLRVSASDQLEGVFPNEPSWRLEDTIKLAHAIIDHGVDLLDVSSAGIHPKQKFTITEPAYQAHYSEAIKKSVGDQLLVSAVGGISTGKVAEEILARGRADVVFVGRFFQKNPGLVWAFAEELGVDVKMSHQMEWPFKGRARSNRKNSVSSGSLVI